jgi:large subunit ribosomal protein L22
MVSVTAKLRYLRITPRKVRLVADLIRGKTVEEAQTILRFTVKKVAQPLLKLLKSAVASAKNLELEELNLYISKILVDEGPKLKRWRARARGSADEIQKKTSHVTIVLDEIVKKPKKVKKVKKARPELVERVEKIEKAPKIEKPKFKPEIEIAKPKIEKGVKRIFRRKAF